MAQELWIKEVMAYLNQNQHDKVFVHRILTDCLGYLPRQIRRPHEMAVTELLKFLGWQKSTRLMCDGHKRISWVKSGEAVSNLDHVRIPYSSCFFNRSEVNSCEDETKPRFKKVNDLTFNSGIDNNMALKDWELSIEDEDGKESLTPNQAQKLLSVINELLSMIKEVK